MSPSSNHTLRVQQVNGIDIVPFPTGNHPSGTVRAPSGITRVCGNSSSCSRPARHSRLVALLSDSRRKSDVKSNHDISHGARGQIKHQPIPDRAGWRVRTGKSHECVIGCECSPGMGGGWKCTLSAFACPLIAGLANRRCADQIVYPLVRSHWVHAGLSCHAMLGEAHDKLSLTHTCTRKKTETNINYLPCQQRERSDINMSNIFTHVPLRRAVSALIASPLPVPCQAWPGNQRVPNFPTRSPEMTCWCLF